MAVLSEGDVLADYAAFFLRAAEQLGAETAHVRVAAGAQVGAEARIADLAVSGLATDDDAMRTCKEADLVIDLMLLLFSHEQIEIQRAGTRMLMVVEPLDVLARLKPNRALRARVEAAERRPAAACTLRFTNAAGTTSSTNKQLSGPPRNASCPNTATPIRPAAGTTGRAASWPRLARRPASPAGS